MRKSFVALLIGVFLLSFTPKANAALILAGDIGGLPGFCATDNNVVCTYGVQLLDDDPTVGTLSISTATVGGLTINGSLHTTIYGPPTNALQSSSLNITNPLGGVGTVDVQASVGATDFVGPAVEGFTTGSGTWALNSQGSSATYTYYNDPTNAQGAEAGLDRPGTLLNSFTDIANTSVDSFNVNGGPFALADFGALFSMTLGFDLHLLDGDGLNSRGQSEIADVAVPEPLSMVLLGTGLIGGGYVRRRQQKA